MALCILFGASPLNDNIYNGILTGYHTNKRGIEEQLMKRFLLDQRVHALVHSGDIGDHDFLQLMPGFNKDVHEGYTWTAFQSFCKMQGLSATDVQGQAKTDFSFQSVSPFISLPVQSLDEILDKAECSALHTVYQLLYPGYDIQFIPYAYRKVKWIIYAGDRIGSQSMTSASSYWPGFSETVDDFRRYNGDLRVGLIEQFVLHTVHLARQDSTQKVNHLLAYVSWKKVHRYPLWFGIRRYSP